LTPRQKADNRRASKRRIVVEQGIGEMKEWRIAAERDRNRNRGHTRMMKNVAGLHNRLFGWAARGRGKCPSHRQAADRAATRMPISSGAPFSRGILYLFPPAGV
jgi:hypothetical protein